MYFDKFYGALNIGSIKVLNHIGINNAYVTGTLNANVNALLGETQYYAS